MDDNYTYIKISREYKEKIEYIANYDKVKVIDSLHEMIDGHLVALLEWEERHDK